MTSQKFNLILTSKLKVMKPSDLKVVVNNTKKDDQDKQDHYFVGGVMQEQIDNCSSRPRRQLYGPFVLERQLNVLVGQTAAGKSVLMVQVLRGIASEDYDGGFPCEASPLKCCYIDCENDTDDWRDRMNGERLPSNILRKTLDPSIMFEDLALVITREIKRIHREEGVQVFGIDNLKWLLSPSKHELEETWKLLKALNMLRSQLGITIILATHSNKDKVNSEWTIKDISGGSDINRFSQSIWAVGNVEGQSRQRYLKQLKQRSSSVEFDNSNVAVAELIKHDGKALQFVFMPDLNTQERNLVRQMSNEPSKSEQIHELLAEKPKMTVAEIAKKCKCSETLVRKVKNAA